MPDCIRWGILGTSDISKTMAEAIWASDTGEIVAIGSRELATGQDFVYKCEKLNSYQSLVSHPR